MTIEDEFSVKLLVQVIVTGNVIIVVNSFYDREEDKNRVLLRDLTKSYPFLNNWFLSDCPDKVKSPKFWLSSILILNLPDINVLLVVFGPRKGSRVDKDVTVSFNNCFGRPGKVLLWYESQDLSTIQNQTVTSFFD